ncbi:hypothetical protein G3I60_10935 [Streptomyces sp. SID13666]|nr:MULTISPECIES: hypothetical protein [Streptomyces]MCZ4101255.1 hypothetical protein [Streptomyces sp. H39-C1]NEA54653.1 hypothetical protein [Streptomyces sp. SID13666]NEA70442.1 hypothetical protein [Streptomyces sp. SID13588]QNA77256.1 hypothetical protein C8250_040335 [Streptomyces sp. So13.3]
MPAWPTAAPPGVLLRTPDGWRIERLIQHRSWEYGNKTSVAEAIARSERV